MAQVRKFGAFAGVFTPSILTILGVIMYLRLPSIVGQAGLFEALGIVAVAHIISVANASLHDHGTAYAIDRVRLGRDTRCGAGFALGFSDPRSRSPTALRNGRELRDRGDRALARCALGTADRG